jgi:hypothetical protein
MDLSVQENLLTVADDSYNLTAIRQGLKLPCPLERFRYSNKLTDIKSVAALKIVSISAYFLK